MPVNLFAGVVTSYKTRPEAENVAKKLRKYGHARVEDHYVPGKYRVDKKGVHIYAVWKSLRPKNEGIGQAMWILWGNEQ